MSQAGGEPVPETGIPTGLNRIKTHRVSVKDRSGLREGDDDGARRLRFKHKQLSGIRRERNINGQLKTHHSKDHSQDSNDCLSNSEYLNPEVKGFGKKVQRTSSSKVVKRLNVDQFSAENNTHINKKGPKGLKSFSHELGPKGGLRPVYTRPHSYNDLKELLRTFHSRFDAAKEVANVELASFTVELMELLQKDDILNSEYQELMEDLLILCKQLSEMNSLEFRIKCETIVQDLSEKRQQYQQGLLKSLLTRLLFILTRCTRLLHFERGSEKVDEKSLHKLKKCLDNVPRVETSWDPDPKFADPVPSAEEHHQDGNEVGDLVEQEENVDSVICRICENVVPSSHVESHSYICAYADKCDVENLDLDGRLTKLAHMLEYITESFNSRLVASYDSPKVLSEGCSPKMSEWRSKGVEGMFEDLHDMDTACIDDSNIIITANLRSYLNTKIGQGGPVSSAGSMTSGSSANTPKSRHFDFFWLEHNNPSEMEDVQQMTEIVDIAHCVAGVDISEGGAHEFLLACMEDLQDILQHSKTKALLIDTFGGRIESLLREKLLLSCDLLGGESMKNTCRHFINSSFLLETASESSASSTPRHPSLKERTSIDDFEIIKPISRGAFGKVFLARKRITGDLFAIKVLKKLDIIRKNDIERILAERNILITVRNPFVVRFFYSFTSRENLYLVMEYLNGGDLFSLLRKVGCLEEDVARIYVAELVLALEYLHSVGIVHRDLKPDNILIAHDGHIKLTDFGLSKIGLMNITGDLVGSASDEITLINLQGQRAQRMDDKSCQSAVGTPDYLAPEILLGTEHGDAADWWSVGIILFELVTGTPPFSAEHPEIIFDNILSRKIPWPSVPEDMSQEAQDLINRLLVHDPDERLGAKGSSEVKAHPFFKGVNWDTLALQKAAFVPSPDSIEDTSYFVSRYTQFSAEIPHDMVSSDSVSESSDALNADVEERDECGDLEQFDPNTNLAWMNFSFKNLSQLASINRDVLLHSWRDPSKDSSKPPSPINRSIL